MKLGIVGYGYVGKALAAGLKTVGYEVFVNDSVPSKSKFSKRELAENTELIFICVQTPNGSGNKQNLFQLQSVAKELYNLSVATKDPPLIRKGTVWA